MTLRLLLSIKEDAIVEIDVEILRDIRQTICNSRGLGRSSKHCLLFVTRLSSVQRLSRNTDRLRSFIYIHHCPGASLSLYVPASQISRISVPFHHYLMGLSRAVSLALGAFAVSSAAVTLSFNVIFAATLSSNPTTSHTRITAIIASALTFTAVVLLLFLLCRQFRYRNGAHIQDFGQGRQHTYLLASFGGVFGILSVVASAVLLGMMMGEMANLPRRTVRSSTQDLVTAAFIIWALGLVSQAAFIVCMVVIQKKDFQQQIQPYRANSEPIEFPEMQESRAGDSSMAKNIKHRGTASLESPPSTGRSRAGSEARSFRSSLSQVVRPINSKTKLIQSSGRSTHRPQSMESNNQDRNTAFEDGFDSWDTSAVDPQARKTVESASPTPQRFLETIPASPTGSRSPSPGFPLDLQPPKTRQRSRSYSPASVQRERPKTARTISPTESVCNEAHIHPLFRTDSPTPPPAATPGTIVVAAIGGGQVMSDRQSIRSIHRMRSGSLPSTPLMHTPSLDSIRKAMERDEWERLEEAGGERTLTPPIPDFILNGGPRNSMHGYQARKKTQVGMGKLGEVRDA